MRKIPTRFAEHCLVAAALFLPFLPLAAYFIMGMAAFIYLFDGMLIYGARRAIKDRNMRWLFLLYFMYVVGMLYTSDYGTGKRELVSKLPFLLFPVLFSATGSKSLQRRLPMAFAAGCLGLLLFLAGNAALQYSRSGDTRVFFYQEFARQMHPTYLAIYINFALLSWLKYGLEEGKAKRAWVAMGYVIGSIFLVLTSSRTGMAVAYLTCLSYAISLRRSNRMSGTLLLFYAILPILIFVIIDQVNSNANRFKEVHTYIETKPSGDEGSIAARTKIWKASTGLVWQNPVGLGTGDVQNSLRDLYVRNNMSFALRLNLNAHNQYLQTLLAVGVPGLAVLLLVLMVPCLTTIRSRQIFLTCFLAVVALNALTESLLEREAGILWFAFFYSLFFHEPNQQEVPADHGKP